MSLKHRKVVLNPYVGETQVGRAVVVDKLKNNPQLFSPLVFIFLCNPLTLSVAGTCKLLLTNRIWQKWGDFTFMIVFHKIMVSIFLVDSLYCSLGLHTLTKPSDNRPQGTEPCQQLCKLGNGFFPSWVFRWDLSPGWHLGCNIMRDPEEGLNSAMPGFLTHKNY